MKRFFLYYALLSKRFFKKPSFMLLLLSIPLLTFGLRLVSGQESGMLKIALCMEDKENALVEDLIRTLMEQDSVLQFTLTDDREEAREAVQKNQADAAWIFTEDFDRKLAFFSRYGYSEEVPVVVVEREDTIPLQLSKIKLFGLLYPHVAYSAYENFVMDQLLPEENLSEEALRQAYEISSVEGSLFSLDYLEMEEKGQSENYITAPLRGLLSLMIILCGFAAAMFFYRDEEQGMFERTPAQTAGKQLFVYELAAMLPAAAVSLVSMYITGAGEALGWEILIMAVFVLDCSFFCTLVKKLLGSAKILGACIPFFLLGMLVLCPVFFSYHGFRTVQILLPPYYYLNAVRSARYLTGMLLHAFVIGAGLFLFSKITAPKKRFGS